MSSASIFAFRVISYEKSLALRYHGMACLPLYSTEQEDLTQPFLSRMLSALHHRPGKSNQGCLRGDTNCDSFFLKGWRDLL